MDDFKIPEDMQAVGQRVQTMTERGFPVSEVDVIKEALKDGLQSIVDERMEGNYYYVRWDSDFNGLSIFDAVNDLVGEIKPQDGQANFIEQFKDNAEQVWLLLDQETGKFVGR